MLVVGNCQARVKPLIQSLVTQKTKATTHSEKTPKQNLEFRFCVEFHFPSQILGTVLPFTSSENLGKLSPICFICVGTYVSIYLYAL